MPREKTRTAQKDTAAHKTVTQFNAKRKHTWTQQKPTAKKTVTRSGPGSDEIVAGGSSAVSCSVVESSGVEQSGVKWRWRRRRWRWRWWSGVEWSGVEWSGVEWSGVAWRGVEWSAVEWRGDECSVVCRVVL